MMSQRSNPYGSGTLLGRDKDRDKERKSNMPGKRNGNEATMGSQAIHQHVEVSSKTGVFHLSNAKLNEFPPDLGKLVEILRSIDMSNNKINAMPINIGSFQNLKHLNLNFNNIETIPENIGSLVKLEHMSLSGNRIRVVPNAIQRLKKLKNVDLSENRIENFPLAFCGLPIMTVLNLSHNRIQQIPAGVGTLQVIELILSKNQIKSISSDLASCPNMKTLRLDENCLTIENFPPNILSESNVSLITIEGNFFSIKEFSELEGYNSYMDRYTSTKKKLT